MDFKLQLFLEMILRNKEWIQFFFSGGFSYFCFFSLGKATQMPRLASPGQSFGFSKEDRGRPCEFLCLSPIGSSKVSHEAPRGAGCGLEARETRVCGWDLGSSAL